MEHLTRQQLCAALAISESTVRRLENRGLPYIPVSVKFKRYDLSECKQWLKENHACLNGQMPTTAVKSGSPARLDEASTIDAAVQGGCE